MKTRSAVISERKARMKKQHESNLEKISKGMDVLQRRTILRGKETGAWLTTMPSIVNGTELSRQEWRDSLLLRYSLSPLDLPSKCDGCGGEFSINHAHSCKHGGLVILRHDEIKRELIDLSSMALRPTAVRDEPLITPVPNQQTSQRTMNQQSGNNASVEDPTRDGDRGDINIRGLWKAQHETIVDVRITDTDAKAYRHTEPANVLRNGEREKKKKYLQSCLAQRRSFTPFVVSTDGLIGIEGRSLLKQISRKLAAKWEQPYSVVCGFVNARINFAILRAANLCIRGSRVPASKMSRRVQWQDGAGLGLFDNIA